MKALDYGGKIFFVFNSRKLQVQCRACFMCMFGGDFGKKRLIKKICRFLSSDFCYSVSYVEILNVTIHYEVHCM